MTLLWRVMQRYGLIPYLCCITAQYDLSPYAIVMNRYGLDMLNLLSLNQRVQGSSPCAPTTIIETI